MLHYPHWPIQKKISSNDTTTVFNPIVPEFQEELQLAITVWLAMISDERFHLAKDNFG